MIYLIVGIILIISTWRPLNTTELFLDLRCCCSYYIDFICKFKRRYYVGTDSPAYYSNYVSPYWETEPGYRF
jgi:hypothetical protein